MSWGKEKKKKKDKQTSAAILVHKCTWQSPSELHTSPAHPCCGRAMSLAAAQEEGAEKVLQWRHITLSPTSVSNCCPPHPPHSFPPPALYSQTLARVPSDGESGLPHCQMKWNNWARLLKHAEPPLGPRTFKRM